MNTTPISSHRHRYPAEIISHAIWFYHQFSLSFREVEELLPELGIIVTYKSMRRWCLKYGPAYAGKLKNGKDNWAMPGMWMKSSSLFTGEHQYLSGAVDQDGDTIDILVQARRKKKAAVRFFRRLLKVQGDEPRWLYTDKIKSYDAVHREMMPTVEHINTVDANNRVEVSHQPTRQQEYHMRGFASPQQAQQFLTLHGLTQNLFRLGRHLVRAVNYWLRCAQSFQVWKKSVCAQAEEEYPFPCVYS